MTFYQELQLNQVGSKALIRGLKDKGDKRKHTLIYLFKVLLTVAFCVVFVTIYSSIFGSDNSIAGVVVLLSVMVFRFADLGIHTPHATVTMLAVFGILAVGPHISNMVNPFTAFFINSGCIFLLMLLGCHNVMMSNHSTFVLGYLLLQGYDVTGHTYIMRLGALGAGAVMTALILYRNHRKYTYKRSFRHLFEEFDLHSSRTSWQLRLTFGISTILLIANLFGLPRAMWAAIAAMSVLMPFRKDLKDRVKYRTPGNILGCCLFLILYILLPESWYGYIGMIGGIGVGFSASYGWQSVFNSFGALSIAVGIFGLPGAIFLRIFHNAFGSLYGMAFDHIFEKLLNVVPQKTIRTSAS